MKDQLRLALYVGTYLIYILYSVCKNAHRDSMSILSILTVFISLHITDYTKPSLDNATQNYNIFVKNDQ